VTEELSTIERLVAGAEDRGPDIRVALESLKSVERPDLPADRV